MNLEVHVLEAGMNWTVCSKVCLYIRYLTLPVRVNGN